MTKTAKSSQEKQNNPDTKNVNLKLRFCSIQFIIVVFFIIILLFLTIAIEIDVKYCGN